MPNMTLSLPEDVYRIVKVHKEIRWSEVARKAIEDYAKKLEVLDALTEKSEFSDKDVMALDATVKAGVAGRVAKYSRKKSSAEKR
jgi:hypothetical protein